MRERARELFGVPAGNEGPGDAVTHRSAQPADVGRHDRRAARRRLERNEAERFGPRRDENRVGGAVETGQVVVGHRIPQENAVGDAEVRSELFEVFGTQACSTRRPAEHQQNRIEARRQLAQARNSPDCEVRRFQELESAGKENDGPPTKAERPLRSAPISRSEDLGVDAGRDHADAIRLGAVEPDEVARFLDRRREDAIGLLYDALLGRDARGRLRLVAR